jgi:hypothetical protein
MDVSTTRNGDIEIAYRTIGQGERPLLLIQGGSAPMEGWPSFTVCASTRASSRRPTIFNVPGETDRRQKV